MEQGWDEHFNSLSATDPAKMERIREGYKALALLLQDELNTNAPRERAMALTELQASSFWAIRSACKA